MRFRSIKFGKIFIVVFLTMLIWVWADLAQDEHLTLTDVTVTVGKSSNPALWVSFVADQDEPDREMSVTLDSVVLKGPASRVAEVRRERNKGTLDLGLFLAPEQEGITGGAQVRTVDVLDFLKQSDEFRQTGLTVESCEPKKLTLQVQELVKMTVPVQCTGLDPSVQASVVPETVEAYVPRDEVGVRQALVRLTSEEQNKAKNEAVEKIPYIELNPGQRDALTPVKVTLAPAQNILKDYQVNTVVSVCFNQNMQGKYRVIFKNDPTDTSLAAVKIKATAEAQRAYAQSPYPHLLLYLQDSDRLATEPIERAVVFNFPSEYVQKGEIKADETAVPKAKFILQPIVEANVESGS